MEFEWDDDNEDHVSRHRVTWFEAEEAFDDPGRKHVPALRGAETRRALLGRTAAGRLLLIVYTIRGQSIRIVTAREATLRERRSFRRK